MKNRMVSNLFIQLIIAGFLLNSCGGQSHPVTPKPGEMPTATPSVEITVGSLLTPSVEITVMPGLKPATVNIPLGFRLSDSLDYDFINQHMADKDILAIKYPDQQLEVLSNITTGQKLGIIAGSVSLSEIPSVISQAKTLGVNIIGYNLEGRISGEEITSNEQAVFKLVKDQNLLFMFGPTVGNLGKNYQTFDDYADILVLQAQRYQSQPDYKDTVINLINQIKQDTPDMKVWVQVSVNPPQDPERTASQVLQDMDAISDYTDGIFIFYALDRWSVVQEILGQLRPIR